MYLALSLLYLGVMFPVNSVWTLLFLPLVIAILPPTVIRKEERAGSLLTALREARYSSLPRPNPAACVAPPRRPPMVSPRAPFVALVSAAVLAAPMLVSPRGVSAQVTHSGTFSLDPNTSQVAPYKVNQAEDVILTVCVTSGPDVEVLVNGNPAAGLGNVGVHGCKTRRLQGVTKITISTVGGGNGGDPSVGTYSLSVTFP
jgi:hypothetical protein